MNDERPIEKLLRRAALERVVSAGEPLELSPDHRTNLQAEVAKQFPLAEAPTPVSPPPTPMANPLNDWWLLIKQRWLYGVAAFAAIWVIALIVAPLFSKPKSGSLASSRREAALPSPAPIAPATSLAEFENAPVAAATNSIAVDYFSGAKQAPTMAPAAMPTSKIASAKIARTTSLSPEPKPIALGGAAKSPPTTTGIVSANMAAATDQLREPVPAETIAALKAESQLLATIAKDGRSDQTPERIRSSQQFSNSTTATRARTGDSFMFDQPLQPLRKQFRIEQSGRDLRVIDSDGSVYRGFVDEAKTVYTEVVQRKNAALSNSFNQKFKLSSAKANTVDKAPAREPIYYRYRAEGTNRTLNQPVTFSWNFIPTNETAAARLNLQRPVLNSSITETQFPAILQSSRLNGVVRYGTAGAATIEANPSR